MDGIILVNKPLGMTSHDVVNRLRRKYHLNNDFKVNSGINKCSSLSLDYCIYLLLEMMQSVLKPLER